jgi:hypothetical protein
MRQRDHRKVRHMNTHKRAGHNDLVSCPCNQNHNLRHQNRLINDFLQEGAPAKSAWVRRDWSRTASIDHGQPKETRQTTIIDHAKLGQAAVGQRMFGVNELRQAAIKPTGTRGRPASRRTVASCAPSSGRSASQGRNAQMRDQCRLTIGSCTKGLVTTLIGRMCSLSNTNETVAIEGPS